MSDIFDGETNTDETQPPAWEDLVGEGKKYSDQNAAAKALFEKDNFIKKLQQENEEARNELKARMNLEELADKVTRGYRPEQRPTNPQTPDTEKAPEKTEETNTVDVAAEFEKLYEERVTKENRARNVAKSRESMKSLYGADYETAIVKASEELGVSKEYLLDMAATSPDGFTRVVQSAVKPDDNRPTTPPSSTFTPTGGSDVRKNNAYFQKMRKEDPKRYFSKQVQVEMHKEAVRQGDGFYQ